MELNINNKHFYEHIKKIEDDFMSFEQHRQILDCINAPVLVLNSQYKFVYVNNAAEKLTGIPSADWIGKSEFDIFPKEQAEVFVERNRKVMNTGEEENNEEQFTDANGNLHTVITTKKLYTNDSGEHYILIYSRDITSEKEIKKALKENEIRFKMIAENASDIIYVHDMNGIYKYVSPSVEKTRGYKPEELIGKSVFTYLLPETVETVKKELAEELESEKKGAAPDRVRSLDLYMMKKDGSVILTESKSTFLRNEKGEPLEIMGIARDITEQRKMIEALAESEKKYHMLADNVTDVIFVFGFDLKYRYVSPSVEKMRGYKPEELIGKPVSSFIKQGSLGTIKKTMEEELEKDKTGNEDPDRSRVMEVEMLCKNGSSIWTEIKVLALRNENGEPVEILGISRDITERKRIENALRESEEKYRFLIEKANEAIIIVQEGFYVFCNRRTAEILEVSPEEIIGKRFLEYVFDEDRDFVRSQNQKRLAGETIPNYDIRLKTATGKTVWVFISGTMIYYKGKPAALGLMTDITARKIAEEEREKLIIELKEALSNVKVLSGLLPICASCKKIRNDKGYWEQIEMYVRDHSDADFSHGICPDCAKKLYPDFYEE